MALSNPITWTKLCTEFSLPATTAVFPRDFYGKGGAPASGTLGFQDFVGRSGGGTFTPAGGTYTQNDNNTSTGGLGASQTITSNSGSVLWTWSKTGSAAAVANVSSGSNAASITFDLPGTVGAPSNATITASAGGVSWTINLNWSGNL